MSNYRPSGELQDNNIDEKLGTRNLVTPSRPVVKPKVKIGTWTSNNNSIIYTHSNITRTALSVRSNSNGNVELSQSHDYNYNRKDSGGSTAEVRQKESLTNGKIRALSALYSTGSPMSDQNSTEDDPGMDYQNGISPSHQNGFLSRDTSGLGDKDRDNYQRSTENHSLSGIMSSTSDIAPSLLDIRGGDVDQDLNLIPDMKNWSNGSCATSDLLF